MKRNSIARIILRALVVMSLAFALGACSSTSEPKATKPPPPAPQPPSEFTQAEPEAPAPPPSQSSAEVARQLQTIYFDFDRAEIRSDARPILRANAEVLRREGVDIVVQGYCDERGSEEYNYVLGESRAHSVMKYLGNLGVSSSQMSIVSYGETRPAVAGHTEAAYGKNRRVEFAGR